MSSVKPIRLNKAARDFNLSTGTVVEFLESKGFKIENPNPNTKLSVEMVEALEKEFHYDKILKQEISQKNKDSKKHLESVTIEDIKKEEKVEEEELFDVDVFDEKKEERKVKEESVEETVEEKVEKEEQKEEIEQKEEQKEEEKETVVVEKEVEKVVETEESPVAANEEEIDQKEKKEPAAEEQEETVEQVEGVKVVGKIDIDSLNQKTRPAKKTKAQKRKEAEEKKKAGQKKKEKEKTAIEAQNKKAQEEKIAEEIEAEKVRQEKIAEDKAREEKDNFIETKYEKLDGPTVVGKIDLPSNKSKQKKKGGSNKPVASSSEAPADISKRKNKRPRIEKQGKGKQGAKNADAGAGKGRKKGHKHTPKPELSEEDIQKQLKETLARLQKQGSKSKASKHRREKRANIAEIARKAHESDDDKVIKVTEFLTAGELAALMDVNVIEVINKCMALGVVVSINQRLDAETISIVAEEFGYTAKFVDIDEEDVAGTKEEEQDNPEDLVTRNPIVTVMGHVDHGKTKLLDYIRHSNVVAGEAGGITQHIGAYEVELPDGRKITFLDTPGHEAFTAMRARGAKVTDIAIIVIAADDAVMPQTKEAITHAQAAGVPIVFAFNKMDKPGANADRIREQLANMNILVEEWGGKYQSQEISAVTGMGVNELLEKVLLEAELLELKANPKKPAAGTVLEASLDKGRGYVANILVQDGTLRKGDVLVAGPVYGRVKALYNERNKLIQEAGPATPALLLGLTGAPQAGDLFKVYKDEKEARQVANKRQQLLREQTLRTKKHITLDEIGRRIAIGDFKELNLIIKGDVDGSVEALSDELLKLSTEEVQVNIIHKAVGAITETDVMLASASDAIIIGFMVRPVPSARRLAEREQVDIKTYSIIYQAKEEIEDAIKGMLTRKTEEKIVCNLEVRQVFKVSKVGTVAGCYVLDGKITRNTKIRLIRDGIVVYTGNLGSLKRFKDDVKEVSAGYECGLNIENFNDIKVGDIIEGYEIVEI